ncbi:MAG: hypothetical protein JWQ49_1313 [Edaphobacter sp.]|nr:hypothetical protein [Edaphobacter sp.]
MLVISEPNDAAGTISAATIHIVRGCDSILRLQRVLADLSVKCGQPGVMDDVGYFLSKPGTLRRVPHLLLFSKAPVLDLERVTAEDLLGAVLLYRYMVLGCGIGMFSTNDRSGRGTLVAPAALRSSLAEMATRSLMDRGVLAVLISFRDGTEYPQEGSDKSQPLLASTVDDKRARWVWRDRVMPDYLPLEETFDGTLAKLGTRTRRNMRYYRKRAEAELGCVFLPIVQIDKREFLNFNRECMYAVPQKVASWRYESLQCIETPLFMGIKDRNGRWLSMLGGRRHDGGTEILWQMNRSGLSPYSLSIVMRSYFMEHEIAHGMTKLYMEGGTAHPMRFSFINDKVTDLVVVRRSRVGLVVPRLAQLFIKPDNDLALMLLDKSLYGSSPNGSRRLASHEEEAG